MGIIYSVDDLYGQIIDQSCKQKIDFVLTCMIITSVYILVYILHSV